MLFSEYIESTKNVQMDEKKIKLIESVYCNSFPDFVKKIISNLNETLFFDDEKKMLAIKEVINASENLEINFQEIKILPLFDFYDNNFLAFDYNHNKWCMFNISDQVQFDIEKSFEGLLM